MSPRVKTVADLFGSTKKIKATGEHKAIPSNLTKPLEWERGIMRLFCEGCGNLVEIEQEFAKIIFRSLGRKIPDNPQNFYFKSHRCGYCDGKNNEIELLPIPK